MKKMLIMVLGALFVAGTSLAAEVSPCAASAKSLVDSYVKIADLLASDKTDGIADLLKAIDAALPKVKPEAKDANAASCTLVYDSFKTLVAKMNEAKNIAASREGFKLASAAAGDLYLLARPAGIEVANCPMANANWLQAGGKIRNPYYGSGMLQCGLFITQKIVDGAKK